MKSNRFLGITSLSGSLNLQSGALSLGSEKRWGERKSLENLSGHLEMTKRDPTFLMWLAFMAVNASQMPSILKNLQGLCLYSYSGDSLESLPSFCRHASSESAGSCPLSLGSPVTLQQSMDPFRKLSADFHVSQQKLKVTSLKHLTNLWDTSPLSRNASQEKAKSVFLV